MGEQPSHLLVRTLQARFSLSHWALASGGTSILSDTIRIRDFIRCVCDRLAMGRGGAVVSCRAAFGVVVVTAAVPAFAVGASPALSAGERAPLLEAAFTATSYAPGERADLVLRTNSRSSEPAPSAAGAAWAGRGGRRDR